MKPAASEGSSGRAISERIEPEDGARNGARTADLRPATRIGINDPPRLATGSDLPVGKCLAF